MNPMVVGKLATAAADLYARASEHLSNNALRSSIPTSWQSHVGDVVLWKWRFQPRTYTYMHVDMLYVPTDSVEDSAHEGLGGFASRSPLRK